MTRWGKADDSKLADLLAAPRNGIDPSDLSVEAVKAVYNKHFKHFKYANFATLYRGNA